MQNCFIQMTVLPFNGGVVSEFNGIMLKLNNNLEPPSWIFWKTFFFQKYTSYLHHTNAKERLEKHCKLLELCQILWFWSAILDRSTIFGWFDKIWLRVICVMLLFKMKTHFKSYMTKILANSKIILVCFSNVTLETPTPSWTPEVILNLTKKSFVKLFWWKYRTQKSSKLTYYWLTAWTIRPRELKFWLPESFRSTWYPQNFEVQVPKGTPLVKVFDILSRNGFNDLKMVLSCSAGTI
jgi:hypothetical protein